MLTSMKRLQIMIDEDLDDALGQRAALDGVSKAALIRKYVREALTPLPPLSADPIGRLIGSVDIEPGDVDSVVYE